MTVLSASQNSAQTVFDQFAPVMNVVAVVFVIAAAFSVFQTILRSRRGEHAAWGMPFILLAASGFFLFAPSLLGTIFGKLVDVVDAAAGEDPTPTSTPSTPPIDTPPPSLDVSGIWSVIAVIAVVLAAIAAIAGIVWVSYRGVLHRRAAAERRSAFVTRWERVESSYQDLLRKITHAETDWDTLFSLPALQDVTVPETAALFLAQRKASESRTELPRVTPDAGFESLPFPAAVSEFALAWNVAMRTAQRLGTKNIPADERKIISEVRSLISITEDSASSPNEREIAYRRIASLVQKLHSLVIPKKAMASIEATAYREIEEHA